MDFDAEFWVVTYLHDWDPTSKVYPEVHSIYRTFQEAELVRKSMIDPAKYFVRRVKFG